MSPYGEQNNEVLMKNHEAHPTRATLFIKMNATAHDKFERRQNCNHGRECGRGKG